MKTPHVNLISRPPLRLALLLIPLGLACFAFPPQAHAVCQRGCDTNTGNTFLGDGALENNTTGSENTAIGGTALLNNTDGFNNTATGFSALLANNTGSNNTATGAHSLFSNLAGGSNTATGSSALVNNSDGSNNTAYGFVALAGNTSGNNNIALGANAGINLTTGDNNIDIGNAGVAGESNTIRIGDPALQTATFIAGIRGVPISSGTAVGVNPNGQLGVKPSSARYKEAIKPMDKASEPILALKPVTFRYKKELDPNGAPQFGLVAEEVAKVNHDLVVSDEQGKPFTVRYEEVNAMLLNEFLKEHRTVQDLKSTAAKQEATIAQLKNQLQATAAHQQKQIEALTATVQKVSAHLELSKPAPRTVLNNQ